MNEKKISFKSGEEILSGVFSFANGENENVNFLFVHGAGNSGKARLDYFASGLAENGISSFRFDFSGHGESSGDIKNSSLEKRVNEAMDAIKLMDPKNPLTILASSMGGEIAIRLTEKVDVLNLLLFCPAIYNRDAFALQFNNGFSDIIRKEKSWENSEANEILQRYRGNLFVYIGENDGIIPNGVISNIDRYSTSTQNKEVNFIPDVGHQIHSWLETNAYFSNILRTIQKHHLQ